MNKKLAKDHGLRIDGVNDALDLISSGVRRCVFTVDDVSADFFNLKTRLAGDVFQKLINYNFPVAFVLPADHPFGERVTELAREHATHPVVRFFPTVSAALAWGDAVIRTINAPEWREYRMIRLMALKDSPDAFASTYEDSVARSDAEWRSRLEQVTPHGDLPLVAVREDRFVGLAWGRIEPSSPHLAHLFQMWVAPECRGAGVGRALLETVIDWARERKASTIELGVTCGDRPARRLYDSLGFVPLGEPIPLRPGSTLLEQPMVLRLEI